MSSLLLHGSEWHTLCDAFPSYIALPLQLVCAIIVVASAIAWVQGEHEQKKKKKKKLIDVVLLSGHAGAGKDTAADLLVDKAGFVKLAFADMLRRTGVVLVRTMMPQFSGVRMEWFTDRRLKEVSLSILQHKKDLINKELRLEQKEGRRSALSSIFRYASEQYPSPTVSWTPRLVLQKFGTEVVRDTMGANVWVNAVKEEMQEIMRTSRRPIRGFVVSDCRFPNEVESILKDPHVFKCTTVRLFDPEECWNHDEPHHVSETAMDSFHFDIVVKNDKKKGVHTLWNTFSVFLRCHGVNVSKVTNE